MFSSGNAYDVKREFGYNPLKVCDAWFCRGAQSALFYYLSCTGYKSRKAVNERKKNAEKLAKEREAQQAIVTEQPRTIPHMQPLPSQTNKGWAAEIKMGRKYDPRQTTDRRVSSGNTRSRANTGDSDRYDYYRAKNPEFDERSPPIVCKLPPPEHKAEVAWMKAPPPSRAVMEGREVPAENAPQRWPLCTIEGPPAQRRTSRMPEKPKESKVKSSRLPKTQSTRRQVLRSSSDITSDLTSMASSENLEYRRFRTYRVHSSEWASDPETRKFSSGPKAYTVLARPTEGTHRVSSLVVVRRGDKSEIRGASYNYDLFWSEQARANNTS